MSTQDTFLTLSGALNELVEGSLRTLEATSEKSSQAALALARTVEQVQDEARQVWEEFARYAVQRNDALAEVVQGAGVPWPSVNGVGTASSSDGAGAGPSAEAASSRLLEQDKGLLNSLQRHAVSTQNLQISLISELSEKSIEGLESGKRLTAGVARYQEALLEWCHDNGKSLLSWMHDGPKS